MRRLVALALALFVSPLAAAAGDSLALAAGETARFPPETSLELDGMLLWASNTTGVRVLAIDAARVSVESQERRTVQPVTGGTIVTSDRPSSWASERAHVDLVGTEHGGWLAIELPPGARTIARGGASVEGVKAASYGNAVTPPADKGPSYRRTVDEAHLGVSRAATWEVLGDITLLLYGPDVALATQENATTLRTGEGASRAMQGTERWVRLTLEDARLRLEVDATVAARSGTASWSGQARFGAEEVGATNATARLAPGGSGGMNADLDTMSAAAAAAPLAGARYPGLALVALVGMVSAGAALAIARRRSPAPTVDECARLALASADEGRYQEAVEWTRRARRLAPRRRRLALDEADFVALSGGPGAAIELLRTLPPGADVDLRVARILAADPARAREAAHALVCALAVAPALVLEVEGTPLAAQLAARPEVARAMAFARRAMEKP